MESYRHATYRYSTGQGFNPIVDVPSLAVDVASFKMEPLLHNLIESEVLVNLKREADRVSMQVEDGMRQIKNLRYDPELGENLKTLKKRVELIRLMMTKYPITFVLRTDLEALYAAFVKNDTTISDNILQKIVVYNKNPKELTSYRQDGMGWGKRVNKGYDIFDQFGLKLDKKDKKVYKASGAEKVGDTLSGFGEAVVTSPSKVVLIVIGLILLMNLLR